MSRNKKRALIRGGLLLLPWLPLFLISLALYAYFAPRQYFSKVVMVVDGPAEHVIIASPALNLADFHPSALGYVVIAASCAFIVGLGMLSIGLLLRFDSSKAHTKDASITASDQTKPGG